MLTESRSRRVRLVRPAKAFCSMSESWPRKVDTREEHEPTHGTSWICGNEESPKNAKFSSLVMGFSYIHRIDSRERPLKQCAGRIVSALELRWSSERLGTPAKADEFRLVSLFFDKIKTARLGSCKESMDENWPPVKSSRII